MAESPYQMTVDLNVLDHLGINLYSNMAAVLTEAVANAWDADATTVDICVAQDEKKIEIRDNGIGMTVADMNEKYLRVGYRRRDFGDPNGKITAKGRAVMGRKGLGKLSLFSIAETIEVQSAKDGEAHGLIMTAAGIKESAQKQEQRYSPDPLPKELLTITSGTRIVLSNIKRQRLGRGITALKKRLARRFSIIGQSHNFEIKINGEPITPTDRGDLAVAQFIWYFGESEPDFSAAPDLKEKTSLPTRREDWEEGWNVTGWIGTARLPKQLDNDDTGNLNGIVVFARGRLFHENILDKLNDGRLYTKYLTGQIEADFLDADDQPDIATSDRQRIQEDDPRYTTLVTFLKEILNSIESRWVEWRKKHEVEKEKQNNPALAEWLDALPDGFKKSAETLVSKISALPIDKDDDRRLMYRHAVLAFERMKLRGSTEELAQGVDKLETVLSLLSDRDALEASLYRDIVKSRLEAIKDFQKIVDDDQKEKILQKYLFNHLWLLDPGWERATGSDHMESRLLEEGVIVADLTEKEKLGRVDIAYRTTAGKHILVELKKATRKMELLDLQRQGQLYVDKLRKVLLAQGVKNPNIEVIFVIGKPVTEETSDPDRLKASMAAISQGSRIMHYDALIKGAKESYAEYLAASRDLDKLESLVNRL
jgi:hypothetical protein